jgi:hypothetical protein
MSCRCVFSLLVSSLSAEVAHAAHQHAEHIHDNQTIHQSVRAQAEPRTSVDVSCVADRLISSLCCPVRVCSLLEYTLLTNTELEQRQRQYASVRQQRSTKVTHEVQTEKE